MESLGKGTRTLQGLKAQKSLLNMSQFSELSLMLGSTVINLGPHQKLQEFGVVNSDILRVRLESEASDNRYFS